MTSVPDGEMTAKKQLLPSPTDGTRYPPLKTNMTMENGPLEDVSMYLLLKNGDFPKYHVGLPEGSKW